MVVRIDSRTCRVLTAEGEERGCTPPGSWFQDKTRLNELIAVGDMVEMRLDGDGGVIEAVIPRTNVLARSAGHRQRLLVANLHQVVVVGSLAEPPLRPLDIDRVAAGVIHSDITPLICLNKTELADPDETARWKSVYAGIPAPVIVTSAATGEGIEELRAALAGRVSAFAGLSGVGKSSLCNALQAGLDIAVRTVDRRTGQGRHTTSFTELHLLGTDAWIADTPGIRVFELHDCRPEDVAPCFPEISAVGADCAFNDCTHSVEPDCAVLAAVAETGNGIAPSRHESYLALLEERRQSGSR